jgi:tetratricopeptide (TPR) repeat protein
MKRQRRQELKHKDEFADTVAWLWMSVKLYQQEILIGGVAALVLVGAGMFLVKRWNSAYDAAWSKLTAIDESAAMARYGLEPKAPDAFPAAIKDYQKLAEDNPRSVVAPMALLRAAKLLHEGGKLDEALKTLDQILTSYAGSAVIVAAEGEKASVLEDKKQFAEALALNEKLARSGPEYLAPECYLNAARCAELNKDSARAQELYQKTISIAAGTSWAQFAEERLKTMAQNKPAPAKQTVPQKKG